MLLQATLPAHHIQCSNCFSEEKKIKNIATEQLLTSISQTQWTSFLRIPRCRELNFVIHWIHFLSQLLVELHIYPRVLQLEFLGCTWRHHFRKFETREPPKLLSSSGMREGKFISVDNFSVQEHASSKSGQILNFRVMTVRDIKIWTCLSKIIYWSRDFEPF